MAIIPQPGANNIEIANEFYKRIAQIEKDSKSDIQLKVLIDNTTYIRQSLAEVEETLVISFGLVVIGYFSFFPRLAYCITPINRYSYFTGVYIFHHVPGRVFH